MLNRRRKFALLPLVAFLLLSGCSEASENVPARDSNEVQALTEKKSSQILELINLKAKATESGATVIRCSDYSGEDVYRSRHPWSLYGVPVEKMRQAMERLRKRLPRNGWEIVKDGHDDSPAKAPQIVADSNYGDFSIDIRLWEEGKNSEREPLILITVVSSCYRSI